MYEVSRHRPTTEPSAIARVYEALELAHAPILLLRVVDLVETGPHSPLAALVKVSPAPMVVR
jgi:hypothetical protein